MGLDFDLKNTERSVKSCRGTNWLPEPYSQKSVGQFHIILAMVVYHGNLKPFNILTKRKACSVRHVCGHAKVLQFQRFLQMEIYDLIITICVTVCHYCFYFQLCLIFILAMWLLCY